MIRFDPTEQILVFVLTVHFFILLKQFDPTERILLFVLTEHFFHYSGTICSIGIILFDFVPVEQFVSITGGVSPN